MSDEREFQSPSLRPSAHQISICSFQSDGFLKDNGNAAQRLLDGVNLVAQSMSELSVKPAKAVTSWLTDQIAPAYWKPNSLILVSDTRSLCRPPPPPPAKSTLWRPEGCLLASVAVAAAPITQSNVCRSQDNALEPLTWCPLELGTWSITCYCFFPDRCAISVTRSSRTTTPSITAVPAGRDSATAAPPGPRPSPREAGVSPPSGCATSASSRGRRTQVNEHSG